MSTLDIHEAAAYLKMNPVVLARKAKSREIPGMKPGKRWVFCTKAIERYLAGEYYPPPRELQTSRT